MFHPFTSISQIPFQIGCSVEESVTIRATEGLEDSANIAHVISENIVSQQSDSYLVLLHIPPS